MTIMGISNSGGTTSDGKRTPRATTGAPFDEYDSRGHLVTTGETANELLDDVFNIESTGKEFIIGSPEWNAALADHDAAILAEAQARIAELQRNLEQANDAMLAAMQSKAELEARYSVLERSSYEKNPIIAGLESQLDDANRKVEFVRGQAMNLIEEKNERIEKLETQAAVDSTELVARLQRIAELESRLVTARMSRRIDAKERINMIRIQRENRRHVALIRRIKAENWELGYGLTEATFYFLRWREFAIRCNLNRREWREEAVEALTDMVGQACYEEVHNGVQLYCTLYLSKYEYAIRKLCELGIMRLYSEQPQRYCFVEKAVNIPRQIVIGDSEADLATDDGGHCAD